MTANWADVTFRLCAMGNYGYFLSDKLHEKKTAFSFVDIGANQGLYSLIAAKNPFCKQIVSFEPVKATFDLLLRNVALNVGREKVQCHQKAVSDIVGDVAITLPNNHSGGATIRAVEFQSDHRIEIISCVSAAEIEVLLPSDLPILVKIDVEGHEKSVISQLIKLPYAARIEAIFYEVDENWVDPLELQDLLRSIGIINFEKVGDGQHYDVWGYR
jgi:FkbM family methyltransferase